MNPNEANVDLRALEASSPTEESVAALLAAPAGVVFGAVVWEGPTPNVENEPAADVLACIF
jgi:hypothetical protein